MPTLLQINSYNFASTGKIMMGISSLAEQRGFKSYTSCPAARTMYKNKFDNQIFIGTIFGRNNHRILSEFTGFHGMGSIIDTLFFLSKISNIDPDIIHIHNIHGSYINIPMLFWFIKRRKKIKVVWTLHDCWAFTGGCPHFLLLNCDNWKTKCKNCKYSGYPVGRQNQTRLMYKLKKSGLILLKI